MEIPSKISELIAFNTRSTNEEHMLIVMEKSNEEQLAHPLQTNNKQFKTAVTFLTGYNGIFIFTNQKTINVSSQNQLTMLISVKESFHL